MLWIDGVGGFLLLLADEVRIGPPESIGESGMAPDVALLADLSRRHARLRREAGSYVVAADGPTWVDGRRIEEPTVVPPGAELSLGSRVRMRLAKPHALSATAVLTVESGHRVEPACDAVVLMAESCVLGPKASSHIRCPKWDTELILFRAGGRGGDGLLCRSSGPLKVGGRDASGAIPLRPGERVEGEDFRLMLEYPSET